jgi:hypothetical protein
MSPILGSFAGLAARGYGETAGVQALPGNFYSIQTQTVGSGGASSIIFNSIPSTYTHLQIRSISADNYGNIVNSGSIQFNSDSTSSNYNMHLFQGNGSSAFSSYSGSSRRIFYDDGGSPYYAAHIIDILDYANTNKYKVSRVLGGVDSNGGNANIYLLSLLWQSTSAITSITLQPEGGSTWQQYSSFALYGVK